jgi:hypothetical protein
VLLELAVTRCSSNTHLTQAGPSHVAKVDISYVVVSYSTPLMAKNAHKTNSLCSALLMDSRSEMLPACETFQTAKLLKPCSVNQGQRQSVGCGAGWVLQP